MSLIYDIPFQSEQRYIILFWWPVHYRFRYNVIFVCAVYIFFSQANDAVVGIL